MTADAGAIEQVGAYLCRFDVPAPARPGPLGGMTIALKDLIASVEAPTTSNSLVTPLVPEGVDAPLVGRLRAAGATIVGKTTLNEFAFGPPDPAARFPIPRIPHDTERWAGGSSGGSAAGVAAGLFEAAIGTDTGGSIRIPAAFCGVVGFKPTFGLVSTELVVPLCPSADTAGPIARTAVDCAAVFDALTGRRTVLRASLAGVTVGVDRTWQAVAGLDPAVAPAFERALSRLRRAGATLVDATVVAARDVAERALRVVLAVESYAVHRERLRDEWQAYGKSVRRVLAAGAFIDAADYVDAQLALDHARAAAAASLGACDLVVSPTVGCAAPLLDIDFYQLMPYFFTQLYNALRWPAISVPMGNNAGGLPLGLQLAGRPGVDELVLSAAAAFERTAQE